ncbi:hypothetical protein BC629DRAFT_1583879 [Irpex lacteus]|nr:hypothetical protein BC629DRAFT_1583879 [Irpex lacteus]
METSFDVESEVSVSSRMTSSRRDDTGRHTNVEASSETGANAEDEIMEISSQDDTDGNVSPEYVRTAPLETSVVHYDEDALMHRWANRRIHATASTPSAANGNDKLVDHVNTTNANEDDDAAASETLSRVINKADFATMDVIGQFNLGFIIARRRQYPLADGSQAQAESTRDDLFIIDQHAADEKYNFEQLQQTTRIESQSLFRPKPLEDLEELLHLLRDSPRGQVVRCSKARSMFAMRACRKSIMVGMPLQHKQMTSPWNCPHGRPTMRHLADISNGGRKHLDDRSIRWNDFE